MPLPFRIMDSVAFISASLNVERIFARETKKKAIETAVQGARSSALNACKFLGDSGKLFTAAVSGRYTFPCRINRSTERGQRNVHCVTRSCASTYIRSYRISVSVCMLRYRRIRIHRVLQQAGKPLCSARVILLISGIEACLRESWTQDRNRGERETPTGKARQSRTDGDRESERGKESFGWMRIAWIRLIKLRIRAASRKWNYRGVVDGSSAKCIGLRTASHRHHHHHHQKVVTSATGMATVVFGGRTL